MPNTNFQTFHQMGNAINDVVRQATGRDNVQNIDMDFVTVAQRTRWIEHVVSGDIVTFETNMVSPLNYLITNIFPVQDLHGQDAPYPAGAGKNKIDNSEFAEEYSIGNDGWIAEDLDSKLALVPNTSGSGPSTIYFIPIENLKTYTLSGKNLHKHGSNTSVKVKVALYSMETPIMPTGPTHWEEFDASTGDEITLLNFSADSGTNAYVIAVGMDATDVQLEEGTHASDYAPYSNICPISGWDSVQITRTGKNLFDKNIGVTSDKVRDDDGTESSSSISSYTDALGGFEPNTKYTISGVLQSGTNAFRIYYLDKNKGWISRRDGATQTPSTFTTPAGCRYVQVQFITASADLNTVQIEKGESASTYEPFGNVYPISLPTTAYGGTLTINKDGSGKLIVDRAKYTYTGDESFTYSTTTHTYYESTPTAGCPGMKVKTYTEAFVGKSNKFAPYDAQTPWGSITSGCYVGYSGTVAGVRFSVNGGEVSDFASLVAGTEVVYELATPVVFDFTASQIRSLLGENNIWTDTDNVTVSYNVRGEVI